MFVTGRKHLLDTKVSSWLTSKWGFSMQLPVAHTLLLGWVRLCCTGLGLDFFCLLVCLFFIYFMLFCFYENFTLVSENKGMEKESMTETSKYLEQNPISSFFTSVSQSSSSPGKLNILFFKIAEISFFSCVYVSGHITCHPVCMQVWGQIVRIGSLLLPWGTWDGTQVFRLGDKHPYPLSHFTSSVFYF